MDAAPVPRMQPYARRLARHKATEPLLEQRPDVIAHLRMVQLLHDFGFEWAAFYSRHKPTPEMTTEHVYLLARDILSTTQHITALLPYVAAHWRWTQRVPTTGITKEVFSMLEDDHRMDSVCARRASKSAVWVTEIVRDWCIKNMPWGPLEPLANGEFRLAVPHPHLAKLRTLRTAATLCFIACKRAVPPEDRAIVERPSAWTKYFQRIFPIAPKAWRPHLEAFLWKYPVNLITMLYLNNDEDWPRPARKVPFTCARAIADIEKIATASRYLEHSGGLTVFAGCRDMYTHLTRDPCCLRLAMSNFPIPLRSTAQPKVFTAPHPVYIGEAVTHVSAPNDNRTEGEQIQAFWKEAIRHCKANEAVVTLQGTDLSKYTNTHIQVPPAVAREAAADLQALADALKRAVSDARDAPAPQEDSSDDASSVYDDASTDSDDSVHTDDSDD